MTEDDSKSGGLISGFASKAIDPLIRAVREELSSARAEIGSRAASAKNGIILVAVGAVLALVSTGLLAAVIVALIALALPVWAAAAIVLLVFALAAAVLLVAGIRGIRRGVPPLPTDTIAHARDRVGSADPRN